MRYAVFSDVHSDHAALRTVLSAMAGHRPDWFVSLGDLFDCKISKHALDISITDAGQVVDPPGEIALALRGLPLILVRGNQEERITRLLPDQRWTPVWVAAAMTAPVSRTTELLMFTHGHELPWRAAGPGAWCPDPEAPDRPVVVHGHHHHARRYHRSGGHLYTRTVRFGQAVPLADHSTDFINVGPCHGRRPTWALIDEAARTVTHYQECTCRAGSSCSTQTRRGSHTY
ncbi:metallophosphoesterase [Nocardiopsis rhodophaea]|uniref:metallophosphoesterase n=1 Tax=Nocardiopsis rhodophaea TaxID=280238 RepID=UPI00337FB3F4